MGQEFKYFQYTLLNYLRDDPIKVPILATFTSLYPATSRGAINLLKVWKKFHHVVNTSIATRRVAFPLVAWALEHGTNTVHIHAVMEDYFSVKIFQNIWKKLSNAAGVVDVREFDEHKALVNYVFKSFPKVSKYMGLSVSFRKEHLYIPSSSLLL